MKAVPCAKCGRVWPKCGRGVAAARQARCAPLLSSILPEGPPRASTRRPAACAAKATAVDAFRGPIRPSLIACGRSVAEVWPMCGRSTADAPCAAVRPSTGWGGDSGHCASDSDQRGRKSDCTAVPGLARSGFVHRRGYVWPKCGRCVARARQARPAPLCGSTPAGAATVAIARRAATNAAKTTERLRSLALRGADSCIAALTCGRSVADVWLQHGRRAVCLR